MNARQSKVERVGRSALVGGLRHIGLGTLLSMFELERRTGIIDLRGTGGQRGRFALRSGRIVRATVTSDAVTVDGALAVYELLTWIEGQFEFRLVEVPGRDEIAQSTSHLLMEAARRSDELAA